MRYVLFAQPSPCNYSKASRMHVSASPPPFQQDGMSQMPASQLNSYEQLHTQAELKRQTMPFCSTHYF
jgi:hypothetical protein